MHAIGSFDHGGDSFKKMIGQDMSVKKTQRKHSSFLTNSLGSLFLLLQRQIIIPHISTLQQWILQQILESLSIVSELYFFFRQPILFAGGFSRGSLPLSFGFFHFGRQILLFGEFTPFQTVQGGCWVDVDIAVRQSGCEGLDGGEEE